MRLFFLFVGVAAGPPYATLPSFTKTATFQLHDGKQMPVMGLGVYMSKPGAETENAVPSAELGGPVFGMPDFWGINKHDQPQERK